MTNKPSQKQLDYLIGLSETRSVPHDHRALLLSINSLDSQYVSDLITSMQAAKPISPQSIKTNKEISKDPTGDMPQEWTKTLMYLYKKSLRENDMDSAYMVYETLKENGVNVKNEFLENYAKEVEKRSRAKFPEIYANERVEGYDNLPFEDPYK